MDYYNNILVISGEEFIKYDPKRNVGSPNGLFPFGTYCTLKNRNKLKILRPHGQGQSVLIQYDSLPSKYKQEIKRVLCNGRDPYEVVPSSLFTSYITPDPVAADFFSRHERPNGRKLDPKKQRQYVDEASILNAIIEILNNTKAFRKALGGSQGGIMQSISNFVNELPEKWEHDLPSNWRRLGDKVVKYKKEGYRSLLHGSEGNQHARKVSEKLENLILSLYTMPNKPYTTNVHELYLQFLAGTIDVVDESTGELFDRNDFYNEKGMPIVISEHTCWNYINDPKNAPKLAKVRMTAHEFNSTIRPHHHREKPMYALSKISLDDRDLRKTHTGERAKAYYSYDVASSALIGAAYSMSKDKTLFIDCMKDMFRFLEKLGLGTPMEAEVEHHLVNNFKDDLMKAGIVFPFVRWCNPGNSQEKHAERFIRDKKYGFEKRYQDGIGRFYARLEANRPKTEKVFDEKGYKDKVKTYSFEELVADDRATIALYNNSLHPNQKRYQGMTRLDVLRNNANPNLNKLKDWDLARYLGEFTKTSIRRNQYVRVQNADYQLESLAILDLLEPGNYEVVAYYLPKDDGDISSVYLCQNGNYVGKCEKITKYNTARAEQTDADKEAYENQKEYVSQFTDFVKEGKKGLAKVSIIENKTDYSTVEVEKVPVLPTLPDLEPNNDFDFENDDDDIAQRAFDSL